VMLAANAVLNNFLLISAFFLDGLANAAEQLCGRAYGARDQASFSDAVRLVILWGMGFALAVTAVFALFGPGLIDIITASEDVRNAARNYLWLVAMSPMLAVFAFAYDGIFIGATWAREMRNLMVVALLIFMSAWLALRAFGNPGCGAPCSFTSPHAAECRRYAIRRFSKNQLRYEGFSPPPRLRWRRTMLAEKVGIRALPGIHDSRPIPLTRSVQLRPLPACERGESSNYGIGQCSAVMAAASAPTISERESRPVRNRVEARSFLMSSTRPSPL
jgi:hypothetical protein